jgi:nucleoside phosphorylase
MVDKIVNQHRAVIITALRVEYQAVCAHLSNLHEEVHKDTVYERGTFSLPDQSWDIGMVEVGAGNASAAFETERAINYFNPEVVLFIGVAGGLKDVELGDVVSATKVYAYESGKATKTFEPRPVVWNSSYDMEQRARAEARRSDWLQRLSQATFTSSGPNVLVAPIAAGEKVIASTRSDIYKFLRSHYGDAVAVEMEGHGFLQAVHANKAVSALIIRGISDLINNKRKADAANYQKIAAQHASAFAFEVLAKLAGESQQNKLMSSSSQVGGSPPMSEPTDTFEIFYSYAEEDKQLVQRLQKQLVILKRRGLITDWYGDKIAAGGELAEHIKHLDTARIILLLISPDFVASEHHYKVEVARAMERKQAKQAIVIPVLLRPTDDWQDAIFGGLQAIPRGNRAVTEYRDLDTAFRDVAKEIREVVEEEHKKANSNLTSENRHSYPEHGD